MASSLRRTLQRSVHYSTYFQLVLSISKFFFMRLLNPFRVLIHFYLHFPGFHPALFKFNSFGVARTFINTTSLFNIPYQSRLLLREFFCSVLLRFRRSGVLTRMLRMMLIRVTAVQVCDARDDHLC